MIEFFRKLFAPEASGATARERLRLVLLSDHLSLAPDVVAALRADLIAVISRYVEVDEANCDVSFEQQDRAVAVLANIPILALRSRAKPANSGPPAPPPPTPDPPPPMGDPVGAALTLNDGNGNGVAAPATSGPLSAPARKRRRRRRAGTHTAPAAG